MAPELFPSHLATEGLYRIRILPSTNNPYYLVNINSPWYALECVEPRNNFYVWGRDDGSIITQYFFVPKLATGEVIRVRLQNEKGGDSGRLRVYKEDGTEVADFHCDSEGSTAEGNHPYFNTYTIEGASKLPASDPGEIYKFVLTNVSGADGPDGSNFVRFSRNVPHYFANAKERLIFPIIHKNVQPILRDEETATQRLYLNVHRDNTSIVPEDSTLRLILEETPYDSSTYLLEQSQTGDTDPTPKTVNANGLLLDGDIVEAIAVDKLDDVYFVDKVNWGTDWNATVIMAYDNGNGSDALTLTQAAFNTIQTNGNSGTFDTISAAQMKAAGVLYTHDPQPGENPPPPPASKKWYCASRNNAMSSKVRFWMMLDEPDAGSGEGHPYTLKYIYDLFLKYNKYAPKPYAFNISQPIFIEEFCQACDVIITDPYVYKEDETDTGKYNQNRISDVASEMEYVAGENKKTVLILWWWFPKLDNHGTADADVYATSWDKGKPLVDGIGGFNYSGSGNRLSTYNSADPTKPEPKLWAKIQLKNRGG